MNLTLLAQMLTSSWGDNPIKKLREQLSFNWQIFDGLGFLFWLLAIPYTIIVVALLIYSIWSILRFLWAANKGQKSLADKAFWLRVSVTILVVFFLFSGLAWDILEQIYSWTSKQEVTTT